METKETSFTGFYINGFIVLTVLLAVAAGLAFVFATRTDTLSLVLAGVSAFLWLIMLFGFMMLEPNEARALVFFGKYRGTFRQTGYFWVNPFMSKKKLSLRARNLDVEPIKVNDKVGNPILIGLVLVWRLKDTYRALFEIDSETMAASKSGEGKGDVVSNRMDAFENFVRIQSDAALRQVAGQYAYDEDASATDELTLRSGGDEINEELERKLSERLVMAGIEVIEARINYLAYAPEIAAVMLRRQQASAIISAREKIVEGAVSMVGMALDKLSADRIAELTPEQRAALVSNLLVVLCADESAQPVVNAGSK